jgi:hypothetical protein
MIAFAALWASAAPSWTVAQNGGAASSGINAGGPAARSGGPGNFVDSNGKTVVGKPLSATEERRTVQILADGTRIENTETNKFYRDNEGRTRIQHGDGSGAIYDPVRAVPDQISPDGTVRHNLPARYDGPPPPAATERTTSPARPVFEEDLGSQSVNGVIAHGSRTTTTIPAGQAGNDRPIHIVAERWYSADLQMDVKTINIDPRSGETTWQLRDILQGAQDPMLFRHPTPGHPPGQPPGQP